MYCEANFVVLIIYIIWSIIIILKEAFYGNEDEDDKTERIIRIILSQIFWVCFIGWLCFNCWDNLAWMVAFGSIILYIMVTAFIDN